MNVKLESIVGFVTGLRGGAGARQFALGIGEARESLQGGRKYMLQPSGRLARLESAYLYEWRRRRGIFSVFPEAEPNPHIIIVGMSGYGKSTLLRHMIGDMHKGGKGAIVFDAHNEHESVVGSAGGKVYNAAYHGLNIFELDGVSVAQRISDLSVMFKDVYRLGHLQASKLSDCLWYAYRKAGARSRDDTAVPETPTVRGLVEELHVFLGNAKTQAERNTLHHLIARISLLGEGGFSRSTVSVADLCRGISSFSLASLKNPEAQMIYIGELLRRLYSTMKDSEREKGVRLYVVLDEAQFLIDSSETGGRFVGKLIAEGRKYGVGVVIATHMASQLDRRVVANASTFITFYPREPAEINYVASLLAAGSAERVQLVKERLGRMVQNEAMVLSAHERAATVVETRDFRDLAAGDREGRGAEDRLVVEQRILSGAKRPATYEDIVARHGGRREVVDSLIADGELDTFEESLSGAPRRWVMRRNPSLSAEHEVCVGLLSERLTALGIRNRIVDNATGPDIMAFSGGRAVAVEYETGRKGIMDTASMFRRRLESCDAVAVFVNAEAYGFYKGYFERPGVAVYSIAGIGALQAADIG